jgi:hypothetical protein
MHFTFSHWQVNGVVKDNTSVVVSNSAAADIEATRSAMQINNGKMLLGWLSSIRCLDRPCVVRLPTCHPPLSMQG